MSIYALVFFPTLGAVLCFFLRKRETACLYAAIVCAFFELLLALLFVFTTSLPAEMLTLPFVVSQGLHFQADGFRKVYVLVIAFMWFATLLLSRDYFRHHANTSRYYFFNLMTLGATMGVFLSADLYTTLVFFEIMSFASFPWVIQEETEGAIRAANTYLAVAVIGGLAALMGIFLLEHTLGTVQISALCESAETCTNRGVLYAAAGCILFGFGAKAGMFPLHIWLPKAHPVAPAPASALLSGVLTKSGIFGVIVLSADLLRGDPVWGAVILGLGTLTMFLGAVLALLSIDLKRTLACSSMSQIGFILIGIGMMGILGEDNALAARGTLLHMMNHSLFKLVLFMSAGVVYMNTHQLDLNEIRGFGRGKHFLNVCFLLGAAGIAGIPGLNGYISKTLLHEGIVEGAKHYLALREAGQLGSGLLSYGAAAGLLRAVEWIFLISGGLTLAYMTKLYVCIFMEKKPEPPVRKNVKAAKAAASKKPLPEALPKEAAAVPSHSNGYMGPLSFFALGLAALLLPVLGLGAPVLMNGIADLGTDFLHAGPLHHAVQYYAFSNLKGGLISIAIGIALYFLLVRKLLMKDGRYVDRKPVWLDLEDRVYRPLLLSFLPAVFGAVSKIFAENLLTKRLAKFVMKAAGAFSRLFADNVVTAAVCKYGVKAVGILTHAVSDLADFLILFLRRTLFRENPLPVTDKVLNSLPYRAGSRIDSAAVRRKKEKPGEHRYARLFYRIRETVVHSIHNLTDSLSFALLALVLTIAAILIYILAVHG